MTSGCLRRSRPTQSKSPWYESEDKIDLDWMRISMINYPICPFQAKVGITKNNNILIVQNVKLV